MLLLHCLSKWSLILAFTVDLLRGVVSARRDIEEVDAVVCEDACEADGVGDGPGGFVGEDFFEPVGGGDAEYRPW